MYINIAVPYVRPKQNTYVRDALQAVIRRVIDPPAVGEPPIDLEIDPSIVSASQRAKIRTQGFQIYRNRIELEELHAGAPSSKRKDLSFRDALLDPPTRATYIRGASILSFVFVFHVHIPNIRYSSSNTAGMHPMVHRSSFSIGEEDAL